MKNDMVSTRFDLVVLAASLCGVEAFTTIFAALPADFPAACALVLHIPADIPSMLDKILQRKTPLHVQTAQEGDLLHPRQCLYCAP